jgi:elongation factor G
MTFFVLCVRGNPAYGINRFTDNGDGTTTVRAQVPMAEMLRYASDLRSLTGGRGTFEQTFSRYDEVPSHIADKVTAEARKQKEAVAAHH